MHCPITHSPYMLKNSQDKESMSNKTSLIRKKLIADAQNCVQHKISCLLNNIFLVMLFFIVTVLSLFAY